MSLSLCKLCKASIRWSVTENGKRIPLDAKSEKRIVLKVIAKGPGARDEEVAVVEETFVAHHITCPNADEFRKRKSAGKPASNG